MKDEILKELEKPFKLESRKGVGGKVFQYVTSDDIVERMNRTFRGNWSTEIIKAEKIEDQILVHVRVTVVDSDTPEKARFFHEGFASQPIARYGSGQNANQIIDIGNVYRAAKSKAIKDAVEKWGVGLRLKDTEEEPAAIFPTSIPNVMEASTKPEVVVPKAPAAQPAFIPPDLPGFAGVTESPSTKPQTKPAEVSLPMEEPIVVTTQGIPKNVPDFDLPVAATPSVDFATPVQKAAIEHIMGWSGLTFKELASKALGREDNLPESLGVIKYKEAVAMIQHGNNLNKA
jgi:Rad52/22 family double-strand break repair protein